MISSHRRDTRTARPARVLRLYCRGVRELAGDGLDLGSVSTAIRFDPSMTRTRRASQPRAPCSCGGSFQGSARRPAELRNDHRSMADLTAVGSTNVLALMSAARTCEHQHCPPCATRVTLQRSRQRVSCFPMSPAPANAGTRSDLGTRRRHTSSPARTSAGTRAPEGGPYGMLVATLAVTVSTSRSSSATPARVCPAPEPRRVRLHVAAAFGPELGFVGGGRS